MRTQLQRCLFVFGFIFILAFTAGCQGQEAATPAAEQPTVVAPAAAEPSTTAESSPTPELTATPEPTATSAPSETPLPDADQARATILQGLFVLANQPNRMTVTTALQDGTTSTNIIEFVPPDRKRIISPEFDVEYIIIGEVVYMKAGGTWTTVQIPAATFMGEPATEEYLSATISEPQFLRLDELAGMAVAVYGYQSTTLASGIELHSQVELWAGRVDGLIYQMISDGETLSVATEADGQSVSLAVPALSTTLIEYEAAINIEAPIP